MADKDIKELKREIREAKKRKKAEKKRWKAERKKAKLRAKRGEMGPPPAKAKPSQAPPQGERPPTPAPDQAAPPEEEKKHVPWVKRSNLSIDQIEDKIDTLSTMRELDSKKEEEHSTLFEKYAQKYGEPLDVPEEFKYRYDMEPEGEEDMALIDLSEEEGSKAGTIGLGKTKKKKKKVITDRDLHFFDLRSPNHAYLANKTGKKGLIIVDIILDILLLPLMIIGSLVYWAKERKEPTAAATG